MILNDLIAAADKETISIKVFNFHTYFQKDKMVQMIKNNSDAIVVLVDKKGKPMFIKSGTEEKYKWKLMDFDRIITVFR